MGEVQTYDLELLGQTYQVRSADEETVVSAVFERLLAEVAAAGENNRRSRSGSSFSLLPSTPRNSFSILKKKTNYYSICSTQND